ncbi:ADP-ribosylglycohydrolase family protein [Prolixibacteraceae bacterium Z1-6]|uniref:ADP-ribosylglycohydrolase family protein n=1 Tax=Draconibacterium aestuarii TaxID=2998507 RepID=A0A9X3F9A1_9BACT|nr:ADP-ribosylglycohydrolase family protein [Prolixibacteraceae bacterium Z1-6]
MKNLVISLVFAILAACSPKQISETNPANSTEFKITLTKSELQDKIKGGWAGQVIGCSFGGPTEFKFNGSMINDYQSIPWNENSCLWYYRNAPGLYDDVYMDLTFVDVFEKEGLDAPATSHAYAFAHAEYSLWHANQAARYNILNGIMPPESGHWLNNPHSEDIDFQIEADFAGLMAPGMVNTASEICDKVGHIMNYGDGWYGGVYMAAMYSVAFVSNNVEQIVTEALNVIPVESDFYKCMADVISWYHQYPNDWKRTWFEVEKKWSADIGCPDGVFTDFNIDAKINAAYVLIGLLYGDGDYSKTLEISTRCGQDSDCNPASAGGILGTMLGYSNIPEYWKKPLSAVEDMDFKYTTMSLNDVYVIGNKHALKMLEANGADIDGATISVPAQEILPVPLEIGFKHHYPVVRKDIRQNLNFENQEVKIEFTGCGFALTGWAKSTIGDADIKLEISIDGADAEQFVMPTLFSKRRHELAWKYELPEGKHKINIKVLNPNPGVAIDVGDLIVYSSTKNEITWHRHD